MINVLSVFDGCSCGRVALERSGIEVAQYLASEVDKYAQIVSEKKYPDIERLGDVRGVSAFMLPKIDLFIGGSPCQGFSFAGKQLNFEDPRSALFFEYARLLEELREFNPDIEFLLENVRMKKEHRDVISNILGVEPVEMNSALVSAQNRKRLYWTNIKGIDQPQDKGILLRDIVHEYSLVDRDKSYALDVSYAKKNAGDYFNRARGQMVFNVNPSGRGMNGNVRDVASPKAGTLTTNKGEGAKIFVDLGDYLLPKDKTENQKIDPSTTDGVLTLNPRKLDGTQTYQQDRIYGVKGKMVAISAELQGRFSIETKNYIRKLTPIECERLQTLPDNYTEGVSNSQRYKMLGNGWTVDVISHILSYSKHAKK